MVFKRTKVLWKGQKATRHFTRHVLQNANFEQIAMPDGVVEWGLYNETSGNRLDVSYQKDMEGVRADFTFFTLDGMGGTGDRTFIREESRPEALFVRRNVANQTYYFEAITLGWDEEEDEGSEEEEED